MIFQSSFIFIFSLHPTFTYSLFFRKSILINLKYRFFFSFGSLIFSVSMGKKKDDRVVIDGYVKLSNRDKSKQVNEHCLVLAFHDKRKLIANF